MADLMFQVVPPCGGHLPLLAAAFILSVVSSRAPVWGASSLVSESSPIRYEFQVVPPCGGHLLIFSKFF